MMTVSDRTYHLLSLAVIAAFLVIALLTRPDYGMGWDEQVRWRSGDLKLEYYQNLLDGDVESVKAKIASDRYPGLFDLPLSAWQATFGGDRMVQGHTLSILFGVLGLIATGWLAHLVFGAGISFLSVLLLAISPHFYGHAMMNPKDIPFMATYTLGLAAVVSVTRQLVLHSRTDWYRYALCGLAVGLAGSSRIPGLVLLVIASVAWPLASCYGKWRHKHPLSLPASVFRLAFGWVIAGAVAFVTVLFFFPRLHFQLFSSLPQVTSMLHSSASRIPLLFAGEAMDAGDGPRTYAHSFLMISTPIWMLVLFFTGIGLSIRRLKEGPGNMPVGYFLHIILLMAAAFPWTYILVTHPALHNGIRHLLFGLPPLVILMAYTVYSIALVLHTKTRSVRLGGTLLFTGCVLFQVVGLVRMHPYEYVSFNLLAGPRQTVPNRYETEYWFTSTKHLLEALPSVANTPGVSPVKVRVSGPLDAAVPFVPNGFVLVDSMEKADYYVSNYTFRSDLLAEGEPVFEITRGEIPIGVILKLSKQP